MRLFYKETNVFTAIIDPTPRTWICHCGDPRFAQAHDDFILHRLGLKPGEYWPTITAGGPVSLAYPEVHTQYAFLSEEFQFLREKFRFERAVVIAHKNCRHYERLPQRYDCDTDRPKTDGVTAARNLRLSYPSLKIDFYYARLHEVMGEISFEHVIT